MSNLRNIELKKLLPSNLIRDEKIKNLANVLSKELQYVSEAAYKINLSNIDDLPESIIDHLLWEYHVEGVSLAETIQEKRELVKNAIELHRKKGTKAALEKVFDLLNIRAIIKEWFEYGGAPYHFKIDVLEVTNKGIGDRELALLDRLIEQYKNVRSWLETINIYLTGKSKLYYALSTYSGENVTVYPWAETEIETIGRLYLGSSSRTLETTTVYPQ